MQSVIKYLDQYAEREASLLDDFPDRNYQHVLIIPAYNESSDFLMPYLTGAFDSLLLILVINQPDNVSNHTAQTQLQQYLQIHTDNVWSHEHLSLHQTPTTDFLCIARYQNHLQLPRQQGVGLARKIACDCALKLFVKQKIRSRWIASTDADATLPSHYFEQLARQKSSAALTFNYQHQQDNGLVSQATLLYEKSLRYYQTGLAWAGSPYAFHSLGSCIAVDVFSYAMVRGFPKRSGGEDFYLLNKLSKVGRIQHCPEVTVVIRSRQSQRVPFGTGPAIEQILQLDDISQYHYYHPQVFAELKQCLECLGQLKPAREIDAWQSDFDTLHYDWLKEQGIQRIFAHHQRQKLSHTALTEHLTLWFDGLMTLRFIHFMRDQRHPNCLFSEAIAMAPFYHRPVDTAEA